MDLGLSFLPGSSACIAQKAGNRHSQLPSGHQPNQGEGFDPNQNFHASWQAKSGRGVSTKSLAWSPDSLSLRDTGLLAPL